MQPQNISVKDTSGRKKRGRPTKSHKLASDKSPSKMFDEQLKTDGSPDSLPRVTSELPPTSEERKEEQEIKAEVVPDLCGMRAVRDITSIILN